MTATRTLALALILLAGSASAALHGNRLVYDGLATGSDLELFLFDHPGYQVAEPVKWPAFEGTQERIWAPRPEMKGVSTAVLSHLPVKTVTLSGAGCGMAPSLLYVTGPDRRDLLFAYEYTICDGSGLLTPASLLDRYVAHYGMYDRKDYDLNMVIYDKIDDRYHVAVRGAESEGGAAIVVTVVDEQIWLSAYKNWRTSLRKAFESAEIKF